MPVKKNNSQVSHKQRRGSELFAANQNTISIQNQKVAPKMRKNSSLMQNKIPVIKKGSKSNMKPKPNPYQMFDNNENKEPLDPKLNT